MLPEHEYYALYELVRKYGFANIILTLAQIAKDLAPIKGREEQVNFRRWAKALENLIK